jgi:hypothetical protein
VSVRPPSGKNEKKEPALQAVNPHMYLYSHSEDVEVAIHKVDELEIDAMWSLVQKKSSSDGYGMPLIIQAGRLGICVGHP